MMDEGSARAARLVVADAHPVVRRAVRMSCEATPGLDVVGEADSVTQLLAVCRERIPDIAILDIALPDGFEGIRGLIEHKLAGAIIVLTDRTQGTVVLGALRLGVEGYLVKASALATVGPQIRRVLAGERVISPEVEQIAVTELGRFARLAREGSEVRAALTPREYEILVLISRGLTMRQMGTRLGISPRTVETHVANLYRKLEVRSRVQAVSRAVSLGLVELR
jgi:DNA-binding NarL/FixJ family response regulator